MHAIFISINDKFSKHDGMTREESQISRPEFGSKNRWRVDNKLIGDLVECCCGLQPGNVGAMTKLCLRIGPRNPHTLGKRHPFLCLLFRG